MAATGGSAGRLPTTSCRRVSTAALPAAGETVGAFRLLAEIGRGAHGRVFLATQPAHATRPGRAADEGGSRANTCVRCSACYRGRSSRHRSTTSRLRIAWSLPAVFGGLYFGGPVRCWLPCLCLTQPGAMCLGRSETGVQAGAYSSRGQKGPACQFPARASYVQVVCWLERLSGRRASVCPRAVRSAASGSQAIQRTPGGRRPTDASTSTCAPVPGGRDPAPERPGGTPGYMAPEQEAAMTAVSEGRTLPTAGRPPTSTRWACSCRYALRIDVSASASRWRALGWRTCWPGASLPIPPTSAIPRPPTWPPTCAAISPTSPCAAWPTAVCRLLAEGHADGRSWLPRYGLLLATAPTGGGWFWHVNRRQPTAAEEALHRGEEQLLQRHYVEATHLFHSAVRPLPTTPSKVEFAASLGGRERNEPSKGRRRPNSSELCEPRLRRL